MKFAIYYREHEFARYAGDPRLAEVDAPSKEEAQRMTSHLAPAGVGTWAVQMTPGAAQAVDFIRACAARGRYDTDAALSAFCAEWAIDRDGFAATWNAAEEILISEGVLHL